MMTIYAKVDMSIRLGVEEYHLKPGQNLEAPGGVIHLLDDISTLHPESRRWYAIYSKVPALPE